MKIAETLLGLLAATVRVGRRRFILASVAVTLLVWLVCAAAASAPSGGTLIWLVPGLLLLQLVNELVLTRAILRVLRADRPRIGEALAEVVSRAPQIAGFVTAQGMVLVLLELTTGLLASPAPILERPLRSGLLLVWSLASNLALPVFLQERRTGLDALRRGVRLTLEHWRRDRSGVSRLRVLWLPLLAVDLALLTGSPFSPLAVLLMVLARTFESIYGAALYTFLVEGVVPEEFDGPELAEVFSAAPTRSSVERAEPPPRLAKRRRSWRLHVGLAALLILMLAWSARGLLGLVVPWPGAAATSDAFPERLTLLWSRSMPDNISAIAVRSSTAGGVIAAGQERLYFLDAQGQVERSVAHGVAGPLSIDEVELDGVPGRSLLLHTVFHQLIAYDPGGHRLWFAPESDVLAYAAIRRAGSSASFTAAGRFTGLCLLDGRGEQRWCKTDLVAVGAVAAEDCDGDGIQDIRVIGVRLRGFPSEIRACYSAEGALLESRPVAGPLFVPFAPMRMLEGDAAIYPRSFFGGSVVLRSERLVRTFDDAPYAIEGQYIGLTRARLQTGAGAELVAGLRNGWIVGASESGGWWGLPLGLGHTWYVTSLAAMPQAGGAEALVVGRGPRVSAWTWAAPHAAR